MMMVMMMIVVRFISLGSRCCDFSNSYIDNDGDDDGDQDDDDGDDSDCGGGYDGDDIH